MPLHKVLSLTASLALAGCGGMRAPLLMEPEVHTCTALELDPVQRMPVTDVVWISCCIPDSGMLSLKVLDNERALVAIIADTKVSPGVYQYAWNPPDSLAGPYFLQLTVNGAVRSKKFIIR